MSGLAESNKLNGHIFLDGDISIWQTNWKYLLKSRMSADDNAGQRKRESAEWLTSEDNWISDVRVGGYLIQQTSCRIDPGRELVQSSSGIYMQREVQPYKDLTLGISQPTGLRI